MRTTVPVATTDFAAAPALTAADAAAHQAASYVRRTAVPTQDSPRPPVEPDARRRFIAQREW